MAYEPIHKDHAIAAVAFAVVLKPGLAAGQITSFVNARSEWSDDLPGFKELPSLTVQINNDTGTPTITNAPGAQFFFTSPDGQSVWEMSANGPALVVVCRLYSRWKPVWAKAKRLLEMGLKAIGRGGPDLEVQEIALEVNDSFKSNTTSALDFLTKESQFLSPRLLGEEGLWHQHSGWFASWDDPFDCLAQLNIDVLPEKANSRLAQIVHRQILRPRTVMNASAVTGDLLDISIGKLHDQNKLLMKELLSREMQDRIGLK